jgi:hypothetical protein
MHHRHEAGGQTAEAIVGTHDEFALRYQPYQVLYHKARYEVGGCLKWKKQDAFNLT